MFTDVEMAILSQLSYCDTKPNTDLATYLDDNKVYLEEELKFSSGNGYAEAYEKLVEKVNKNTYTVVATENDPITGFAAFAVEGPNNEVTVACRGTELNQFVDILADIELGVAQESAQQKKMEAFVRQLETNGYSGYYFTGHSLGGNLAMHGAVVMQDPTLLKSVKTFDAPGYNMEYLQSHEGNIAAIRNKATSYQNKRDAISETLYVPGNIIVLDCIDPEAKGLDAHRLNHLVLDESGESFSMAADQKKETTGSGLLFEGLGYVGNIVNATNKKDCIENVRYAVEQWIGTEIKVPLSVLQENAQIMQELTDTNADIFDRIYNSLLCLKGSGEWQGTSLEAIVTETEQNKRKFADTITEMKTLADYLNKFTTEIEEKDRQIRNQINAV